MPDYSAIAASQRAATEQMFSYLWKAELLLIIMFLGAVLLQLAIAWFVFKHLPRLTNAIALYFERKAGGHGTAGIPPAVPTAPAPTPEELRAQAYKSVSEIERRYGQKKP